MKVKLFFMAALAAVIFVSCSKESLDGEPTPPVESGEPAVINILIPKTKMNANVDTRAATPDDEGDFNDYENQSTGESERIKLKDGHIFIADASGSIITSVAINASHTPGSSYQYTTTTAAARVYIVGNYDNYPSISSIGSLTDLKKVVTPLSSIDQTSTNYATDKLIVVGTHTGADLDWSGATDTDSDGRKELGATVTLEPLATKINVTVVNKQKNYIVTPANSDYVIKDLSVLYSSNNAHLFVQGHGGSSPVLGVQYAPASFTGTNIERYYTSGLGPWSSYNTDIAASKYYTFTGNTSLVAAWPTTFATTSFSDGTLDAQADQTFKRTFYVYAGIYPGDKPLIVTLRAGAFNDATKDDVFYPIILDEDNHLSKIITGLKYPANGRAYQVKITLTGNAKSGGGGSTDPEIPVEGADVDITIEQAEWIVVPDIAQEFN